MPCMKHYCHPVVTVGLVHLRVLQSWASPGTLMPMPPSSDPYSSHFRCCFRVTSLATIGSQVRDMRRSQCWAITGTFSWIQKHNSLLPTASWTLPTMSRIPNFNMLNPVFIPLLQTSPMHTSTTVTKATIRSLFLMMIYVFVLLLTQP